MSDRQKNELGREARSRYLKIDADFRRRVAELFAPNAYPAQLPAYEIGDMR